jgi:very-short-patch-repair endonuclease
MEVTMPRVVRNVPAARELRQRQTISEDLLWQRLRNSQLGYKCRRQHPIDQTLYVVDFYCQHTKLIVEIDGAIHGQQIQEDQDRQAQIEALGYRFIRVSATMVEENIGAVLNLIRDALNLKSE